VSRISALAGSLVAAIALAACASQPQPVAESGSQRRVPGGEVVGFADAGAYVWRGIPFASAERWRPPGPPEPWQGVREALAPAPACPQFEFGGEVTGTEDCLALNVFAPRDAARLPVMVFIHGGGNSMGSAAFYDGARLAEENRVVVVTIQYRLGVLGWFAHEALRADAASPEEASGNFATLDMIRALAWVRDHIAAFGGDPSRVTLFGESAGGVNVFSLLLSPAAQGLFHRAITQSGFAATFSMAQAENRTDDPEPGESGSSAEVLLRLLEQDGSASDRVSAKRAADAMGQAETAAYLRGKSARELLDTFARPDEGFGGIYVAPFALRDGHVIPDEDPLERFARGAHNQVPVVLGTNRDEHKLFLAFLSPHVRRVFNVPLGFHDRRRYDLVSEYGAKLWKASGADEPAAAMRDSQGPSVFGYRFDWDELARPFFLDLPSLIGAGHALELLFVFGGTDSGFGSYVVEHEQSAEELSQQMRSYWAQLAYTGSPGRGQSGELPEWAPWSNAPGAARFMVFDSSRGGGLRMSPDSLTAEEVLAQVASDQRIASTAERCEIYQTFVQWSDAVTPEQYETLDGGVCKAHPLTQRTIFD